MAFCAGFLVYERWGSGVGRVARGAGVTAAARGGARRLAPRVPCGMVIERPLALRTQCLERLLALCESYMHHLQQESKPKVGKPWSSRVTRRISKMLVVSIFISRTSQEFYFTYVGHKEMELRFQYSHSILLLQSKLTNCSLIHVLKVEF